MDEPFLGEVQIWAANFAPAGWAFCNGQLLPIAQNAALFSILGTTYGGDGRVSFALPNLQGRTAIGAGQGPGLSDVVLGASVGAASVALDAQHLPPHQHGVTGTTAQAVSKAPAGAALATGAQPHYSTAAPTAGAESAVVGSVGGGVAVNNQQPGLNLNFIIALQGVFPQRG